jgi:hypothetical protein
MKFTLNKTQNFYYKRAILGLRIYNQEELSMITHQKKERIKKVYRKSQNVLQVLRYRKLIEQSNTVLSMFFTRGNMFNELMKENSNFITSDMRVTITDKQLGLTKDEIIVALLESGVLGPNFLNLK